MTETSANTVAEVDRLVAGMASGIGATPGVETRDVVQVTGPWMAGTTSLVAALRQRLPDLTFVETGELGVAEAPAAVVFVASAAARLTESDCELLDLASANTDLVIGVVSKIDVHRNWRDVLAADSEALTAHAARYRDVPWVGVAAAPELGDPKIDELVERLGHLADNRLARRNRLRAWETRLQAAVRRCEDEASGAAHEARMAQLREQRTVAVRDRRLAKSERTLALRSQIQQARQQLTYFARNRCMSVRGELQEDAAGVTRRRLPAFEEYVRERVDGVVVEVDGGITKQLGDVASELGLGLPADAPRPSPPPVPAPQLSSRKLETRLMLLLGVAFGLGLALTLSRLLANLAPAYTLAGLVAGGVVGLAVTVWVVRMRGLLHDRAILDRWVSDVITELQAAAQQLVGGRVLAAETAMTAAMAERDEDEASKLADRVAAIDTELREEGLAAAHAAIRRKRELPRLQDALNTVRAELDTYRVRIN